MIPNRLLKAGVALAVAVLATASIFVSTQITSGVSMDLSFGAPTVAHSQPTPRTLLGIFGTTKEKWTSVKNLYSRNMIRKTYLDFDRVFRPDKPNRVCSLEDFSKKVASGNLQPYDCPLVYTFVLGGNETYGAETLKDWSLSVHNRSVSPLTNTAELRDFELSFVTNSLASDILYFDVGNRNRLLRAWLWYQYASRSSWIEHFDYIAHTGTNTQVFPASFWGNSIFSSPSKEDRKLLYAGYEVTNATCRKNKSTKSSYHELCPSLEAGSMMQSFVLFSRDLLETLVGSDPVELSKDLQGDESFEVALANCFEKAHGGNLRRRDLEGVKPYLPKYDAYHLRMKLWDKYVETKLNVPKVDPEETALVTASGALPTNKTFSGPRILLGIFSMDNEGEKLRRDMLRRTWLSYYDNSTTPHRICSLYDLMSGSIPGLEKDCQLAYAFVAGGNLDGPTELLAPNASFPITVDRKMTDGHGEEEKDMLYLNIRENMEDGKSPTWFKYATGVLEDHYFDYIGKTDSDTLILPWEFLEKSSVTWPIYPNNARVYIGDFRPGALGPVYMAGELYLLSSDLARFVTSPGLDRESVDKHIEDLSMGNFVHLHPLPIRRKRVVNNFAYWHPFKSASTLYEKWKKLKMHHESHDKTFPNENLLMWPSN